LAGPGAGPLTRLLARLTATPATECDLTSGRLDRVAGVPGGMEIPIGAAADRWAKSAGRAAAKAARYLSLVRAAELRGSLRSQGRPRYQVVG
jgi:hypothetical protein